MIRTSPQHSRDHSSPTIPGDYQQRALLHGHPVQRRWHAAKLELIQALLGPSPEGPILDAGCGSGVVSAALAAGGARVVGVDANPKAIAFAQRTFARVNLRFVEASLFDFMETGFTTIVCLECIEHFPQREARALLRHLRQRAAPGGRLFLTTPNYHSAWPAIEAALDLMHLTPRLKGEQHLSRFDPNRLARLLEGADWDLLELGSFNGLAPFLAPLSAAWAEHMEAAILSNPRKRVRTRRNLLYAWCRAGGDR